MSAYFYATKLYIDVDGAVAESEYLFVQQSTVGTQLEAQQETLVRKIRKLLFTEESSACMFVCLSLSVCP